MSVVATVMRELIALGVSGDALVAAVDRIATVVESERVRSVEEAVEKASAKADRELEVRRSTASIRMARYRAHRVASGMNPNFEGSQYVTTLKARDGDLCVYCVKADGKAVDHMLPVSKGGTDDLDNLALACTACNCGKAGRMLSDDASEIKVSSARSAYVRYVRERSRTPANGSPPHVGERTQVVTPPLPSLRSEELKTPISPNGEMPPQTEKLAQPASGFAKFWAVYPNKTGKGDAEAKFRKALKLIHGPDPPGQIIAAVERAKLGRQWSEGFIPNPATWLHQRRWEDEIEPPRKSHERTDAPRQTAREDRLGRMLSGALASVDGSGPPMDPGDDGIGRRSDPPLRIVRGG